MVRDNLAIRCGVPLLTLVVGASLALAACAGSGGAGSAVGSGATGVPAGSGAGTSQCATSAKDYKIFIAGKLPVTGGAANVWDALTAALGHVIGDSALNLTPLGMVIYQVAIDANTISNDMTTAGAPAQDYQQFDADLQALARACGTSLTPLPKSLTG